MWKKHLNPYFVALIKVGVKHATMIRRLTERDPLLIYSLHSLPSIKCLLHRTNGTRQNKKFKMQIL